MKKSMLKPRVLTTAPETTAANAPEMSSTESNTPRSIPLDGLLLTTAINAKSAGR